MARAAIILPFIVLNLITWRAPAGILPTALWSIGTPTDEEQYYLELINRSRRDPAREGERLAEIGDPAITGQYNGHSVKLDKLKEEMASLPVRAPLAMNAILLELARAQSAYQFELGRIIHTDSNGLNVAQRAQAAGYLSTSPFFPAENSSVDALSTLYGHASFEVDWGVNGNTGGISDGMQNPRDHRNNLHAAWREVGIGIKPGNDVKMVNGRRVGPQVITQDFGYPAGPLIPYVTGVAYYDFNGNSFYDPGEGIGGLKVNVAGSLYHAITPPSGGYAIPVPAGAAERAVTFSGLGFNVVKVASFTGTGTNNRKVDLDPAYSAPVVSGPSAPVPGMANIYTVSTVNGASGYDWRVVRKGVANDPGIVTALPAGANLFPFVPAATGAWLLSARPVISGRTLSFGPATEVNTGIVIPLPSFASWAAGFELAAQLPAGTLASTPAADHNHDGVPNLMTYALGLSPVAHSSAFLPQASVNQGSLRLDYSRDTAKSDITLTPQTATDLRTWFTPGQAGAPAGFSDVLLSTAGTIESRRAAVPADPGGAVYLRLRVTKP